VPGLVRIVITYKLVIEYVGTGFAGWQVQPSQPTVQGELLRCLRQLFGDAGLRVAGAARTDAGTHAHGQVASFDSDREWEPSRLKRALNRLLPDTIGIVEATHQAPGFHARRSATGRIYKYQMALGECASPFLAPFVHRYHGPVNVPAMEEAARHFLGEHDFTSFKAAGDVSSTSIKEMRRSLIEVNGDLLIFTVEGSSFLQHMVRTMAGSLLEVGRGFRAAGWLEEVIRKKERAAAGPTLPAKGLFLVRVLYDADQPVPPTG
jgi:tRNA pseudouridine38-40 synthase